MRYSFASFITFLKDRFSLGGHRANEDETIEEIRKSVEFKGVNVWVLVFAIFIASIGLNLNSTAIIIGAMLISPLMGPIMGLGLGVGISDVELIKKSAKNLALMVIVSVATSAIYFLISPVLDEKSELLARTTPAIWDVFIGLFGGLAGIVAVSTREHGNVIPGVAIATALMPPLCTAGYGLAVGDASYFFGAFYLFTINSTFICFATILIVRFLDFQEQAFVSPQTKKRVKTLIGAVVIVVVIPSIYIAQKLIRESLFEEQVQQFVNQTIDFPATEVLKYETTFGSKKNIEITLIGKRLDDNTISNLNNQLRNFQLEGTSLTIKQAEKTLDAQTLKSQIMEDFISRNLDSLDSKKEQIDYLAKKILEMKKREYPTRQLSEEMAAIDPNVEAFSVQKAVVYNREKQVYDTLHFAYTKFLKTPEKEELKRLQDWLKVRIDADSLKVFAE
ncbi:MAG: DUF389 domain-containing protein [Saprospiraceae bacterium]